VDEQRIRAPWRIGYVSGSEQEKTTAPPVPAAWREGADEACFLCRAAARYDQPQQANRQNLVVEVTEQTVAILNCYPYTNGHLLVSPLRHVAQFHELTDEEHLSAMQMLSKYTQILQKLINAEGFNVGVNLGQVAGAGVPGHLHWHLVPRWPGDNNFMPTLAGTRMIPQSLEAVWEALVNNS
jgi:ATP adenylyltransferase